MVFFCDSQGTIRQVVNSPVYQGSNNANEVVFVAPFVSSSAVTVSFILPNGIYSQAALMTLKELTDIVDENGNKFNAWIYLVPEVMTEYSGIMTAQFKVTNGDIVTATASSSFNVQKGVPNVTPEPSEDIYQQILSALSDIQQKVDDLNTEVIAIGNDKLDKVTGVTQYNKAYIKNPNGTQGTMDVTHETTSNAIMSRDANGRSKVATPSGNIPDEVVNVGYLINKTVQRINSDINRLYSTTPNNPNNSIAYTDQPNGGTIMQRTPDGRARVADGIEDSDAATYGQTIELLNGIELVKTGDLQYQLNVNGKSAGTIDIPKDQFLKSVTFNPETNVLTFVFSTSEGDVTTEVDMSDLIDVYTAGNGLNLTNNEFSVKLDGSANNALKLTANGLFVDKTQFESAADATEKWEQQVTVNAGKLDKVTTAAPFPSAYVVKTDGRQGMLTVTEELLYETIVKRDYRGNFKANDPSSVLDVANKYYVDTNDNDIKKELRTVPRMAVSGSATSGESVTVQNTPLTELKAQDYGTIFTHKRLWDGKLYDEGFNQLLNKADYPATTTMNGITFTNKGDGTITVNGTATDVGADFLLETLNFPAGKYLIKGCPSGGSGGTYNLFFTNQGDFGRFETGDGLITTLSSAGEYEVNIRISPNTQANNLVFKPQLINLTAFENATGKTINTVDEWNALYPDFYDYVPTLSPETPLEIVPSGNKSNIVSSGKNLVFNKSLINDASKGITVTANVGDTFFRLNGTNTGTDIGYRLAYVMNKSLQGNFKIRLTSTSSFHHYYVQSAPAGTNNFKTVDGLLSCLIDKTYSMDFNTLVDVRIGIAIDVGVRYSDDIFYVVVSNEEIPDITYVPYVTPITTSLNYTAVNSAKQSLINNAVTLGDYASERNGNTVTVKTGKYVFTGTETLTSIGRGVGYVVSEILPPADTVNKAALVSDRYETKAWNDVMSVAAEGEGVCVNSLIKMIGIVDLRFGTDVTAAKAYLAAQYAAGTPVTVYYALATPETVEIEEITPIPTFGDNNTTFTSEAVGTTNAPVIMDFTTYIAKNLPKGYALLKDKDGNLVVAYTQTNMLMDVNTDKYLSDLLDLKDTATGKIYKLTVTNGAVALVEIPNETTEVTV